ncbi:MAG: bacillithiol biosynthesis BshC, partial [Planctomycetes bacterium]|nr:bacillithiol biosynthesis BshC [Planctomycetota bacterium]
MMKVERLPFDRLSGRFPATALAYATTFEELRSRYEVDYRDRRALVERARDVRNRRMEPAVIERLRARLKALDAPAAARAALAKLEGGAAAVVTGQQPGAAWGPLYNIYKAVTAIRLARGLEAEGVPSVAVFWNHSDDHHPGDLGRVRMPDSRNSPIEVTLPLADDDRPLYDRSIDPAFVDRLSAALPDTPHRAEVARVLGDAARGSLSEWFSRSMLALFGRHGLIVLEPRDLDGPRAQAVLERALREEDLVERCVAEGGEAMARLGFKPSLAGPFGTNVYAIEGGRRVRAAGRATPTETRLSAGVALRLIVQDSTLPTAAYVGGPNEVG